MPWVDLDDVTTSFLNLTPPATSVRDAWERAGERAFRDAEVRALDHALRASTFSQRVIALGGGTPTATPLEPGPSAESLLRIARQQAMIRIIYLRASPRVLRERLEPTDHASRPSLTGTNFLDEIPRVFAQRDPLYATLADQTIDVDTLSPAEVCDTIEQP